MGTPAADANPIFLTAAGEDSGGQYPSSIAAGDFNHDGKLDLVVVNSGSNNVAILLGRGDGTYQSAVTYLTAANATYVAVADLNGDGFPDLAVGAGPVIDVFLGNGDGTFRAAVSYNSGGFDTPSLAFGDFNGDGKVDLVVAHTCTDSTCANSSVSILLGNGDGTLHAPTNYAGGFGYFVEVGDFNGDGKLDITVAGWNGTNLYDFVSILLGNGDGTFQPAVTYNAGGTGTASSISMTVGDFNADGRPDLAVADFGLCGGSKTSCYDATVNVLMGNGDGTFQPVVSYSAGSNATDVISADLNGDGKLDLIVTNYCGLSSCSGGVRADEGTLSVLLGTGDGTFQPAITLDATVGAGPTSVVTGDFNNDGKLDLAVANQESLCCTGGSVGILLGNRNGTFQTTSSFSTGAFSASSVVIGDFNGDGKPDLVVGSSCYADSCINDSWISVLLGNGDETFGGATTYRFAGGGYQPAFIAAADFNHDGKLDLVATGSNGNYGTDNLSGVSIFFGNGDGTLQPPVIYSSNGVAASWVGVGDFNGDGNPDLAVANACADSNCANGSVAILLGNGNGTFQDALIDSSIGELGSFVIGDFNNDGNLDLAMPETVCSPDTCSGSFVVLIGKGDGTFRFPISYDTGGLTPVSVVTADFNGDGKADLAVMNACTNNDCTDGDIGILLGNGDGTFQAATTLNAPANANFLATGDVNGDGKTDLLISGEDSINVMLGNGDGSFQMPTTYLVGGGGHPAVGDLNGDGKPDVALPSTETVSVLTNIAAGFRYATSTVVASSADPANVGQSITFTAMVTGAFSGPPTGTVTFNDDGNSLGTATLNDSRATLMTTLSAGSHAVTTIYNGDSTFLASTSPALMETVNAAPDFSLASSALAPASVVPGGSSTATVSITAGNGFSGSVALTCSVTPSPTMAPTCSINPASIDAGTTATLTVSTTGLTASAMSSEGKTLYPVWLPLMGLMVAGVCFGWPKPRQRKRSSILLGWIALTALSFLVACSGDQTNKNKSSQTPEATYSVTVVGTSSGSLQHSVAMTLGVQ
ncbi:MAG TPA: FG-GAP-like repeat-containing protein [Candidatus Sulfotelmatobacter sp.]|nr:FG-GAP-like repeat-containing protein [Candidatus Sulfotelmatobacter sp.]